MIDYRFGPMPDGMEDIVNGVDALGQERFAQSLYDTRAAGLFGNAYLRADDPVDVPMSDELLGAQHVFWGEDGLETEGVVIDMDHAQEVVGVISDMYRRIAMTNQPIDAQDIPRHLWRAANLDTVVTLELTRGVSGGFMVYMAYPKFVFTDGDLTVAKEPVGNWSDSRLHQAASFSAAVLSRTWHTSNRTGL